MTYQQAGRIAVLKRILGWVIFYTCIDLYTDFFAEIYEYPAGKPEGINAVMLDFTHVMIDMMQANTPF